MVRSECSICHVRMLRTFTCARCRRHPLCSSCCNNALVDFTDGPQKPKAVLCCRPCFVSGVSIDMTKSVDEYGGANGEAPAMVWVHGGGSSRAMYRTFAEHFAGLGYRCVLPDLPGHGSKLEDPLSIDSAVAWLAHVVAEHASPFRGVKPIYVGGSFGGYIGMELLGRHPTLFSGAVIISAAQTVGVGAGVKATLGLGVMKLLSRYAMVTTLVGAMLSMAGKHKHLKQDVIRRDSYESGWYFQSSLEQVDVLRHTDSQRALKTSRCPVLFLDGDQDYADQRAALVQIAKTNEIAQLAKQQRPSLKPLSGYITYAGGDHFFTHDDRFSDNVLRDLQVFFEAVAERQTTEGASPNKSV